MKYFFSLIIAALISVPALNAQDPATTPPTDKSAPAKPAAKSHKKKKTSKKKTSKKKDDQPKDTKPAS